MTFDHVSELKQIQNRRSQLYRDLQLSFDQLLNDGNEQEYVLAQGKFVQNMSECSASIRKVQQYFKQQNQEFRSEQVDIIQDSEKELLYATIQLMQSKSSLGIKPQQHLTQCAQDAQVAISAHSDINKVLAQALRRLKVAHENQGQQLVESGLDGWKDSSDQTNEEAEQQAQGELAAGGAFDIDNEVDILQQSERHLNALQLKQKISSLYQQIEQHIDTINDAFDEIYFD